MYIQQFLFDLWRCDTVNLAALDEIQKSILSSQKHQFVVLWDLLTLNQKKALRLLAETGGEGIYAAEQLQRVGFNSGSVLQRALMSLVEKEILSKNGRFEFQDTMLKILVQRLSCVSIYFQNQFAHRSAGFKGTMSIGDFLEGKGLHRRCLNFAFFDPL